MASPLVSVVFVWKVTAEVVWCAEQGGVQVEICVRARHISHRNFRVRQKEKENRDFFLFFENRKTKKFRPSWRHRRLSRAEEVGSLSSVFWEVIVIGLLLDFIDRGCRQ